MKKITLTFGFIAGLILTTVMVVSTMLCYNNTNFEGNMLLGYASMLLAFSFIFVGTKNYRDNHLGGTISFGKAFQVGLYISLVASTMYVLTWLVEYYVFIPDFMDKYGDYMMRDAAASGKDLIKTREQVDEYKRLYQNPVFVIILTYIEVLPIGLLLSLVSALIFKRKDRPAATTLT